MGVQSLGREDALEEGIGSPLQYSCLENPMDRGASGLRSLGSQRVRHDRGSLAHTQALVQSLSCVRLFATPWTAALQAFLSFTISWSLLQLKATESVMPQNHLIPIASTRCTLLGKVHGPPARVCTCPHHSLTA